MRPHACFARSRFESPTLSPHQPFCPRATCALSLCVCRCAHSKLPPRVSRRRRTVQTGTRRRQHPTVPTRYPLTCTPPPSAGRAHHGLAVELARSERRGRDRRRCPPSLEGVGHAAAPAEPPTGDQRHEYGRRTSNSRRWQLGRRSARSPAWECSAPFEACPPAARPRLWGGECGGHDVDVRRCLPPLGQLSL